MRHNPSCTASNQQKSHAPQPIVYRIKSTKITCAAAHRVPHQISKIICATTQVHRMKIDLHVTTPIPHQCCPKLSSRQPVPTYQNTSQILYQFRGCTHQSSPNNQPRVIQPNTRFTETPNADCAQRRNAQRRLRPTPITPNADYTQRRLHPTPITPTPFTPTPNTSTPNTSTSADQPATTPNYHCPATQQAATTTTCLFIFLCICKRAEYVHYHCYFV